MGRTVWQPYNSEDFERGTTKMVRLRMLYACIVVEKGHCYYYYLSLMCPARWSLIPEPTEIQIPYAHSVTPRLCHRDSLKVWRHYRLLTPPPQFLSHPSLTNTNAIFWICHVWCLMYDGGLLFRWHYHRFEIYRICRSSGKVSVCPWRVADVRLIVLSIVLILNCVPY